MIEDTLNELLFETRKTNNFLAQLVGKAAPAGTSTPAKASAVTPAAPAAAVAPKGKPGRPAAVKAVTFDDMKAVMFRMRETLTRPVTVAWLKKVAGTADLLEVPEAKYASVMASALKHLAAHEAAKGAPAEEEEEQEEAEEAEEAEEEDDDNGL